MFKHSPPALCSLSLKLLRREKTPSTQAEDGWERITFLHAFAQKEQGSLFTLCSSVAKTSTATSSAEAWPIKALVAGSFRLGVSEKLL